MARRNCPRKCERSIIIRIEVSIEGTLVNRMEKKKAVLSSALLLIVELAVSFLRRKWQGRNQVYGIRDHSLGIGIMDPGSRVTSDGIRISQFFLSWRGSRIDRFLDTLFFMRNKKIPFCKEKGLFSGLLKKLLTFILQFFYVSVTQSAV